MCKEPKIDAHDHDEYCIRKPYRINPVFVYRGEMYTSGASINRGSAKAYGWVADWMSGRKFDAALDIGCGDGSKIKKYIAPNVVVAIGVDTPRVIKAVNRACKDPNLFGVDVENYTKLDLFGGAFDLVTCIEVIEHLGNPDRLFDLIRDWSSDKTRIVLSTPERDHRRMSGPPENKKHVREWTMDEFSDYLSLNGLKILDSTRLDNLGGGKTLIVVCKLA